MNTMQYPFFIYEHENGEIIKKVYAVCTVGTTPHDYFDSPFVKRWALIHDGIEESMFMAAVARGRR